MYTCVSCFHHWRMLMVFLFVPVWKGCYKAVGGWLALITADIMCVLQSWTNGFSNQMDLFPVHYVHVIWFYQWVICLQLLPLYTSLWDPPAAFLNLFDPEHCRNSLTTFSPFSVIFFFFCCHILSKDSRICRVTCKKSALTNRQHWSLFSSPESDSWLD